MSVAREARAPDERDSAAATGDADASASGAAGVTSSPAVGARPATPGAYAEALRVAIRCLPQQGYVENIARFVRFRGTKSDEWIELQVLKARGESEKFPPTMVAHIDSEPGLLRAFQEADDELKGIGTFYVLNEVHPLVRLRAHVNQWNRVAQGGGTSDSDIVSRRALYFDFDPVRPVRGISASDEESRYAIDAAIACYAELADTLGSVEYLGYGFSGNGAQVYVALDQLPNSDAMTAAVKEMLLIAKCLYGSPQVEIDISVSDARRLCPAFGTIKRKGIESPERPHRRTYFHCEDNVRRLTQAELVALIDILKSRLPPEQVAEVDKGMGRRIAALKKEQKTRMVATSPLVATSPTSATGAKPGLFRDANDVPVLEVAEWLGIVRDGHPVCPGCGTTGDSSVAFVGNGIKCLHARCAERGRAGFRTVVDIVAETKTVAPTEAARLVASQFSLPPPGRHPANTATAGNAPPMTSTAILPAPTSGFEKPIIVVTTLEHDVVDQAQAALAAHGGLYQRGGVLVQVVRDGRQRANPKLGDIQRAADAPHIAEVTIPRLREELTRAAIWKSWQSKNGQLELVLTHPPKWAPEELAARGSWSAIPYLEAVVETPVLRPDGTVLQEPGYDAQTGILFEPNANYMLVADAPTQADARQAASDVLDAFADFPVVGEEHTAAILAAVLTPFARSAFEGPSPMVAIDAPAAGTGKSLLVDSIAMIVSGRGMARMSQASNEDEERKRITSIAMAGDPLVLLDNVTRPLGSGALDAALTGKQWTDRFLGQNKMVRLRLPMTWFTTGNNLQLVGDTPRRILNVRLDARMEQPEQRTEFKHVNLLDWLRKDRARLVHAALTILRAFFAAGCPAPEAGLSGWGSFEEWSRVVRGAVIFAGLKDPADTRRELRGRADSEATALMTVLDGLETLCGGTPLEAVEIVERIHQSLSRHRRLHAALLELRPLRAGQTFDAHALGYALRKFRDRVVGDRRLVSEKVGDRQKWRVERLSALPSATASSPVASPNSNAGAAPGCLRPAGGTIGPSVRVGAGPADGGPMVPPRSSRAEQGYFDALHEEDVAEHLADLQQQERAARLECAADKKNNGEP